MKVKAKCPWCEGKNIKSPTESCGVCTGGIVEVELIEAVIAGILAELVREDVSAEREACAKLAEDYARTDETPFSACHSVADSIRARGQAVTA